MGGMSDLWIQIEEMLLEGHDIDEVCYALKVPVAWVEFVQGSEQYKSEKAKGIKYES